MRRSVVIAGFATAFLLSAIAEAQVEKDIKIGVLGGGRRLYADIGDPGSVAAGEVLGSGSTTDFSFYRLRALASKARIIVAANASPDAIDRIKQACGSDKPYGDVEYADPGYQDDNKKRYPIDTEKHIRAAWSYINRPRNAGKYSADELTRIKNKIIAAWKDKIDPGGPPSAAPPR